MPGQAYPKHAIKRVDRLLGNQHLRAERALFYWVMLRALLGSLKHPLILVDWSRFDASGDAFLLRAAVPFAGRSFPIYESVHERESCPKYQSRLLKTLAALLPEGCVPVLVTDAGFRRPWMKAVGEIGVRPRFCKGNQDCSSKHVNGGLTPISFRGQEVIFNPTINKWVPE